MKNKLRYFFIPLLTISLLLTFIYIVIYLLRIFDTPLIRDNTGIFMYPFINFILLFEAVLLYLTDFSISFSTLFCLLLIIINALVYIMLVYKSIKGNETSRKNASGIIIFLTCIDILPSCACSLTNFFSLILALALRVLIIYSCAINIKLINDF